MCLTQFLRPYLCLAWGKTECSSQPDVKDETETASPAGFRCPQGCSLSEQVNLLLRLKILTHVRRKQLNVCNIDMHTVHDKMTIIIDKKSKENVAILREKKINPS